MVLALAIVIVGLCLAAGITGWLDAPRPLFEGTLQQQPCPPAMKETILQRRATVPDGSRVIRVMIAGEINFWKALEKLAFLEI